MVFVLLKISSLLSNATSETGFFWHYSKYRFNNFQESWRLGILAYEEVDCCEFFTEYKLIELPVSNVSLTNLILPWNHFLFNADFLAEAHNLLRILEESNDKKSDKLHSSIIRFFKTKFMRSW